MRNHRPFYLTTFEYSLWGVSLAVVLAASLAMPERSPLPIITSLLGVTALIFVAKGRVAGQALSLAFSILYGLVSYTERYYGEMITYLGMTAPIALISIVTWMRNPNPGEREVKAAKLTGRGRLFLLLATLAVTGGFAILLARLDTPALALSIVSIATSFLAASLTAWRSPFYALAYAANDLVLIALWLIAALQNPAQAPMIACFLMFLANDLYGFVSWRRMMKRQGVNL